MYDEQQYLNEYRERDPYYPHPIVPDAIHHGPIHEHFPPRPRTVTVEENVKVAEIKDAFQNLRYKVSLTSFDSIYIPGKKQFQIQVLSFYCHTEPIIIVSKPEPGARRIYDYDKALKMYNDYVENYTNIVKAETKDFQDITIYQKQIGYKLTEPKCCFTCKWCKKEPFAIEYSCISEVGKLECHNPKNSQAYKFDSTHRHDPWHEHCHDPMFKPFDEYDFDHRNQHLIPDIHPNVEFLGVCDNYEKNSRPFMPMPSQKIAELIDYRVDTRVDGIVPEMVTTTLSTSLSSELSTPVIQAITLVLSSPEASVALSAPVVNLVTHSQEIHTQTVNVIGTALSTDALSAQMFTAVSSTFQNPEVSSMLETPVANAMATSSVQKATVNVIGTALSTNALSSAMVPAVATTFSQPEISAAMVEPVANTIQTVQVSSNVISVIENGIVIEKIIGNNGIARFIDKNNNGIQDPDEPDLDDTPMTTVILGDLGA